MPQPLPAKPESPAPAAIREARLAAGLTQTEAALTVRASLRAWQQWEAGDRAMPPGLFELFMLKTGQWLLHGPALPPLAKHA
ncbi:MAG: XRE family transcriptional regulator [Comamonas sp.]